MADEDITANLPSLQFESALTPQEKELLYLRARSHALTLSSCAQGAFLVAILNGARQKIMEKKCPAKKKASKLLQEAPKRDPILVGIIGCGRVGKQLANTLMKYADVQPEELFISTRRPETLSAFQARGVHCGFDNIKVCSTVDILFIACLPSQFDTVAKEVKGHLLCPVYILTGAIPLARIRQILEFDQVIKPETSWKKWDHSIEQDNTKWEFERDLVDILGEPTYCEMTCPLRYESNNSLSLVSTNPQWAELALFSFINVCTAKKLMRNDVILMCNTVFLGFGPTDDTNESLTVKDVAVDEHLYTLHCSRTPDISEEQYFPIFDLGLVNERRSHVGQRLSNPDDVIRKMFVKRYKSVFDKFQYWKGMPTHSD